MTQGAWISPRLQKVDSPDRTEFQNDFIAYLTQYKLPPTDHLITVIKKFDFTPVKAVLIGSTPGNYHASSPDYHAWGLNKLQRCLRDCPGESTDRIQAQVSSIATLGPTDAYFTPVLGQALNGQAPGHAAALPIDLVFPTVENIQESINGYGSGSSIHFRHNTTPGQKQLEYLKSHLCTWTALKSGRAKAAPHIKTYMRASAGGDRLRWILLTSANLSKQAWGNISNKDKNLWIQSFELGVLLHPALFGDTNTHLIPTYKRDAPTPASDPSKRPELPEGTYVAIRMPYDLPLVPYNQAVGDVPWCAQGKYSKPDWRGDVWPPPEFA